MKHIKRLLLVCLLCGFAFTITQAQNYYIDFTASGATTTLDSVFVENLTQGTSLSLLGSDTLHLIGTGSINDQSQNSGNIRIYPNPFTESSNFEFYCEAPTVATIDVYDVVGKHIVHLKQDIQKGTNLFEVSGFATGHYKLSISTDAWQKTAGFVSLNTGNQNPQVQYRSSISNEMQPKSTTKNTKSIVPMSYNTGDQLRFIGFSGLLSEIANDVPTSSKTIDFLYSSSSCGVIYTDVRDGNQYPTVLIDTQCWMAKNLAYLPSVVGTDTGSETTPYYYVYGYNDTIVSAAKATSNFTSYGVLYNWSAAMAGAASSTANPSGVQGICPTGWHLPSDAEWSQLTTYLGGESVAGGKLKETGTTHWNSPNTGATNETGFSARPGGVRSSNEIFLHIGDYGGWRSSSEDPPSRAWSRGLHSETSTVTKGKLLKDSGLSVRCVRD